MTLRVGVHGASGRMGRVVIQLVHGACDLALGCAIASPRSQSLGADAGALAGGGPIGIRLTDTLDAIADTDVVVDFALPGSLAA